MSSDMEGLSKAEEELHNLQLKYQQREVSQPESDTLEEIEVSKLKEEVEVLRLDITSTFVTLCCSKNSRQLTEYLEIEIVH